MVDNSTDGLAGAVADAVAGAAAGGAAGGAAGTSGKRTGALAAYRRIVQSRVRAQAGYRVSFATDIAATLLTGLAELTEVYVIFHNTPRLGGLDFDAALLVFALANLTFAAADLLVGHCDRLPTYIKQGRLDVFYLRPLSLLGQLITSEVSLRRLGRISVALVVLVVALARGDVQATSTTVGMLSVAVVCGTALMAGLFVAVAGLQFWLVDGREFANAFTYGGAYAAQQSSLVFPDPVRIFFTFVVPAAFTAYLPTLVILGLPGGDFADPALAWWLPVAAAWVWVVALVTWRGGVRHYQGAGG